MNFGLILVIGGLTFAIRAIFVLGPTLPEERLRPLLKLLPAAVLPVLAASSLHLEGDSSAWMKWVAVAAAAFVAWKWRSVLYAMAVGMGVLWVLKFS